MRISDWSSDVCSSDLQFMQQDKIALPFPRTDMVKRERIKFFGEPRQLMIVRSKEATASVDLMHSLHHGPGKRKPVIGRRAAPDFIQNDEAPLGCLTENRGGFDHFDHEGDRKSTRLNSSH